MEDSELLAAIEKAVESSPLASALGAAIKLLNGNPAALSETVLSELLDKGENSAQRADHGRALVYGQLAYRGAQILASPKGIESSLLLLGKTADALQDYPGFRERIRQSSRNLRESIRAGATPLILILQGVDFALAYLEKSHGDFASARSILVAYRDLAIEQDQPAEEASSLLALTETCGEQKDLEATRAYAMALAGAYERLGEHGVEFTSRTFAAMLTSAQAHYYAEDFPAAARLAKLGIAIDPHQAWGHLWLGNAELKMHHAEAAIVCFERAIAIRPQHPGCHLSHSIALWEANWKQEAVAAVGRAIEADPADPRGYLNRSTFLMGLKRFSDALPALEKLIAMAGEGPGKETSQIGAHSMTALLADIPDALQAEIARLNQIDCYVALERTADANDVIQHLLRAGSNWAKLEANKRLAGIRQADYLKAAEALSAAIEISPVDEDLRMKRADLHLGNGATDTAIDDLSVIGRKTGTEPGVNFVLNRLDRILRADAGNVKALKCRGALRRRIFLTHDAARDLTRVIELAPEDGEAYYWRALARLADDFDGKRNEPPSIDSIIGAARDLVAAARLPGAQWEALDALKWMIDYLAIDEHFLALFCHPELGIFEVLPDLQQPLVGIIAAGLGSGARRWDLASEQLISSQSQLEELGLRYLAIGLNIHIADNFLRLYEVQKALDRLGDLEIQRILDRIRPLSPNFKRLRSKPRFSAPVDMDSPFGIELDFMTVQLMFWPLLDLSRKLLCAEAIHRMGNAEQAVKELGPLPELVSRINEVLPNGSTDRVKLSLVPIFRDGGNDEVALAMLGEINQRELLPQGLFTFFSLRGTILLKQRRLHHALSAFKKAANLAPQLSLDAQRIVAGSLATVYSALKQPHRALEMLNSAPQPPVDEISQVALGFRIQQAEVYLANGDWDSVNKVLLELFKLIDRIRVRFRAAESRMNWMSRFEQIYAMAIAAQSYRGDTAMAFHLCESGRARTFVDQLASGSIPMPADAEALMAAVDSLTMRKQLLDRIEASLEARAAQNPPYEMLAELKALDPEAKVMERAGDGSETVSRQKLTQRKSALDRRMAELRDEIDDRRLRAIEGVAGSVLEYGGLHTLLSESSGGRRVVLLEFFVFDDITLAFIGRSDLEKPEIRTIERTRSEIERHVKMGTDATAESEEPDEFFSAFLNPLLETSPGGGPFAERGDLVWIVPHDALHYVPFHAVTLDGGVLAERNLVCYSPSASVMEICRGRDLGEAGKALVIGDPRGDLPHARTEAVFVAECLRTEPLMGKEATHARVQSMLRQNSYDVVHFAGHGRFDNDKPLRSSLLLAPDGREPDELTAEDFVNLGMKSGLTVLGGCQTGVGERRKGDELLGLTRAVLAAGSTSAIVSLWRVDDISTGMLMREFYRRLQASGSLWRKADALREAQLYVRSITAREVQQFCDDELAALGNKGVEDARLALTKLRAAMAARPEGDRPFAQSYYWAPFLLVGYWR